MKVAIILLFLARSLGAGMGGTIVVEGRIGDFDAKSVTVVYGDGGKAKIPRSAVADHYKIRSGNYIRAAIKSDFLEQEIVRAQKKTEKKTKK